MLCNLSQNQKNRKEFHVETISKRKKRNKKMALPPGDLDGHPGGGGILCVTGVLAAPVFPIGTKVSGVSVSEQSAKEAGETLQQAAEDYKLTVRFAQNTRTFSAKELGLTVDEDALKRLVKVMQAGAERRFRSRGRPDGVHL